MRIIFTKDEIIIMRNREELPVDFYDDDYLYDDDYEDFNEDWE